MLQPVTSTLWLPPPPPDFSLQCRGLKSKAEGLGPAVQFLAGFRLSTQQLWSLSREIGRALQGGAKLAPLSSFRLGILSNATFDPIVDALPAASARHGVALTVTAAPFDQVVQLALDADSEINRSRLDAVLLAVDHRWFNLERLDLGAAPDARIAAGIDRLRSVVEGLSRHGGASAILQTVPTPPEALFGSFDRRMASTSRAMIDQLNRSIAALSQETGSYLLDVAALAERVGTDLWFDPMQWVTYKLPFSPECFPAYADAVGRLLGAARGKARKCLVLDLDNTVWGGVIGDDGVENLAIGQGTAAGEAFLAIQALAINLRERGVVLAVSSKNDDPVARKPFRKHPEMLLRESHISVFQANWTDKPSNLRAIANRLNIGLDALVLLDDNPAERAHVRAALPMVAVPELPENPSWYPRWLSAAGYFEAVSYSEEDSLRAKSYEADAQRAEVLQMSQDLGDYLSSLGMTISMMPFDKQGRQRIGQLVNKTNQFNLTTRRYTEAELVARGADAAGTTLQVRLKDRFGDLGMIGVVICSPTLVEGEPAWNIEAWLMSCRVLGRRVEEAMLQALVAAARSRGVKRLIGTYVPTPRNGMVADHYTKLDFEELEPDGTTRRFQLLMDAYRNRELPFQFEGVLLPEPA